MAELRGAELLRAAVNNILDHPETFDQTQWHCGTKHCIAGHCQILGGRPQNSRAASDAEEMLGISKDDADWLFAGHRSLPEIHNYAYAMLHGYDRDGYNRDGYGRNLEKL